MAWGETNVWLNGTENQNLYQQLLDDAETAPDRNAQRKKIVRPHEMPWEMSRQGLLKHLINEGMKMDLEPALKLEQRIIAKMASSKERQEAVQKAMATQATYANIFSKPDKG